VQGLFCLTASVTLKVHTHHPCLWSVNTAREHGYGPLIERRKISNPRLRSFVIHTQLELSKFNTGCAGFENSQFADHTKLFASYSRSPHTHTHNTHTVARLQYTNTAQCRRARHVINFRVGIRQLVGVLACNAACQRIIGGARAARFNTRRFDWQAGLFALLSDKQCRLSPGSNMGYRPPHHPEHLHQELEVDGNLSVGECICLKPHTRTHRLTDNPKT